MRATSMSAAVTARARPNFVARGRLRRDTILTFVNGCCKAMYALGKDLTLIAINEVVWECLLLRAKRRICMPYVTFDAVRGRRAEGMWVLRCDRVILARTRRGVAALPVYSGRGR